MAGFHVYSSGLESAQRPAIRRIGVNDIAAALRRGVEDFREKPSHLLFLALIYPVAGVVLARWTSGADALQLIFPLVSGFALIGPFAALGLYEISRRREMGQPPSWRGALDVRRSPAIPGIAALALFLILALVAWLTVANAIFATIFGAWRPQGIGELLSRVLSTPEGWLLILVGNLAGFVFAAVVLATTVVAFPMMLDRDCGVAEAVLASLRATLVNPGPVALWGLVVAAGLVIGSLPLLAGLAVVMPVLGHATWHLYRRLVEPPDATIIPRS